MFYWGMTLGIMGASAVWFLSWMLHTVVGGLTREGERRAQTREAWRRSLGRRWKRAEIQREARRQLDIKLEMERMEAAEVGAER